METTSVYLTESLSKFNTPEAVADARTKAYNRVYSKVEENMVEKYFLLKTPTFKRESTKKLGDRLTNLEAKLTKTYDELARLHCEALVMLHKKRAVETAYEWRKFNIGNKEEAEYENQIEKLEEERQKEIKRTEKETKKTKQKQKNDPQQFFASFKKSKPNLSKQTNEAVNQIVTDLNATRM